MWNQRCYRSLFRGHRASLGWYGSPPHHRKQRNSWSHIQFSRYFLVFICSFQVTSLYHFRCVIYIAKHHITHLWEEWADSLTELCSYFVSNCNCISNIYYYYFRLNYNTLFLFVKASFFILKQKEQSVNALPLICIRYIDFGSARNRTRFVYRWHRTAFRSACRYGAASYRLSLL